MIRKMRYAVAALGLFVGGLLAADGVVVKLDGEKLTVKVDGKDRVIELKGKRPHVHGADGKHLKPEQYKEALKEGVKVEIEEEGGKVLEITIKK